MAKRIQLYESNSLPHTYALTVTYSWPGIAPKCHTLKPPSSPFTPVFKAWKEFFRSRCGVEWDFRIWNWQMPSLQLSLLNLDNDDGVDEGIVVPIASDALDDDGEAFRGGSAGVKGSAMLQAMLQKQQVEEVRPEAPPPSSNFFSYKLLVVDESRAGNGTEYDVVECAIGEMGRLREGISLLGPLKGTMPKFVGGGVNVA